MARRVMVARPLAAQEYLRQRMKQTSRRFGPHSMPHSHNGAPFHNGRRGKVSPTNIMYGNCVSM